MEDNYEAIKDLLTKISYKKNWKFDIFYTPDRAILRILINCDDSTGQHQLGSQIDYPIYSNNICEFNLRPQSKDFYVEHNFSVPSYPLDEEVLMRWLFDRIVDVEAHEAMEFFKLNNTTPYFPDHSINGNPYVIQRR